MSMSEPAKRNSARAKLKKDLASETGQGWSPLSSPAEFFISFRARRLASPVEFLFLPSPRREPVSEPKGKVRSIFSSIMIDYRTQSRSVKQLEFDWVRLNNFDWVRLAKVSVRLLNPIEIDLTTRVRLSPLRNQPENTGTLRLSTQKSPFLIKESPTLFNIQFDFNSNSHKH